MPEDFSGNKTGAVGSSVVWVESVHPVPHPRDERTAVGLPGRESCLLVYLPNPVPVEFPMKKAIVALLLGAAIITTSVGCGSASSTKVTNETKKS